MKLNIEQKVDVTGEFWYEISQGKKTWFSNKLYYIKWGNGDCYMAHEDYKEYVVKFKSLEEAHLEARKILKIYSIPQTVSVSEFGVENL